MAEHKRCAIYGITSGYGSVEYERCTEQLKAEIRKTISEGYKTFVTTASEGYELGAALYIEGLKKENPELHLIIVQPYDGYEINFKVQPLLEKAKNQADLVKYMSNAPYRASKAEQHTWIMRHCTKLICVTSSPKSDINRLGDIDLSGIDTVYIPVRNIQAKAESNLGFPDKFLFDILGEDAGRILSSYTKKQISDALEVSLKNSFYERDILIIRKRFAYDMTLQQVGDELGLSRERIRQLEVKALQKLRHVRFKDTFYAALNGEDIRLREHENKGRKNRLWTAEENIRAEKEYTDGKPIEEIARLHDRSEGAIRSRLQKLGLIDTAEISNSHPNSTVEPSENAKPIVNPYRPLPAVINTKEIIIDARQVPGHATFNNFEELKEYISKGVEVYKNNKYSPENIEQARRDFADLKNVKKKLTDARKSLIEAYSMPIETVAAQLDELINMVKEPYNIIDRMLRTHAKEIKRNDIMLYARRRASVLGKFAEKIVSSPAFFNIKWCNRSYSETRYKKDIDSIIYNAQKDIEYILNSKLEDRAACLAYYFEKLSLGGIVEFAENLKENTFSHKPDCVAEPIVDSSTGEVIELSYTNAEINKAASKLGTPVSKYIKISGTAENITQFLKAAEKYNIDVEEVSPV